MGVRRADVKAEQEAKDVMDAAPECILVLRDDDWLANGWLANGESDPYI